MIEDFVVLLVSLGILLYGSQMAIKHAVRISKSLKKSQFSVGFILLALTTSLPELFVSISSSLQGQPGIALGNVIGSNIANIALILGLAGVLFGIKIKRSQIVENSEILLLISLLPLYLLTGATVGPAFGLILVAFFIAYLIYISGTKVIPAEYQVLNMKTHRFIKLKVIDSINHVGKSTALFLVGVAMVILGSHYLVNSSISIIEIFLVPPEFVGLTIIAIGTSLPELVTTITAYRQGHTDLALGNIIGSCVTNLTLVLGSASILAPITATFDIFATAIILLVVINLLTWYSLIKNGGITKYVGAALIGLYILFLAGEIGLVIL